MQLEPVTRARRDERPPCAVLLDPQLELVGAHERCGEVLLFEHHAEVVDSREVPLAGLYDHVHRTALDLGKAELEADRVQLLPRDTRLVAAVLLLDAAVARNELEAEFREVPGLDLAHFARDEVIVEELHRGWRF